MSPTSLFGTAENIVAVLGVVGYKASVGGGGERRHHNNEIGACELCIVSIRVTTETTCAYEHVRIRPVVRRENIVLKK